LNIIKIIFNFLIKFAISIGVDKQVAFLIPLCLSLLLFAVIITFFKSLFKSKRKKSNLSDINKNTAIDGRIAMRRFDRTEVNLKGSVASYTLEDSSSPSPCQILDVSATGLGCTCRESLEKGTRMKFSLPNYDSNDKEKIFYISGAIVRINPIHNKLYEYGISFFHVFKREANLLELVTQKFSS